MTRAIEAVANALIGYGLIVLLQMLVFPVCGLDATLRQHLGVAAAFTLAALLRTRLLPPLFNPATAARGRS